MILQKTFRFVAIALLLTIGLNLIIHSCCTQETRVIDYCQMIERDQSYTNPDEIRADDDWMKREAIFLENFDILITETRKSGFPHIETKASGVDSCRYWAVIMTLVHMAQAHPELLFTQEIMELFKSEVEKGNLTAVALTPLFKISFVTNEFCEELKEKINQALQEWGVSGYINSQPRYKKC